jgi:hypothetical protein
MTQGDPIRTLREAVPFISTGIIDCNGGKCRLPNCEACYSEPEIGPSVADFVASLEQVERVIEAARTLLEDTRGIPDKAIILARHGLRLSLEPFGTTDSQPQPAANELQTLELGTCPTCGRPNNPITGPYCGDPFHAGTTHSPTTKSVDTSSPLVVQPPICPTCGSRRKSERWGICQGSYQAPDPFHAGTTDNPATKEPA